MTGTRNRKSHRRRKLNLQLLDQRQLLAGDVQLVGDDVSLQQNAAEISLDVLGNDTFGDDYDGDQQITGVSTGSKGGQIRIIDGESLLYRPPADFAGQESFVYFVDGDHSATVNVSIESPLPEFSTVIQGLEDQYDFNLLEGADFGSGYTGDQKISILGSSSLGSDLVLSDDGQTVTYRPQVGVTGTDSFTYIVDNRFFAIARIDIENVLAADQYAVLQLSETTNLDLLANDFLGLGSEVADDATITHVLSDSEDFEVQIASDGRSVNFTPVGDFYGTARFRYVVNSRVEQTASVLVQRPVRDNYFSADINGGVHTFDVLRNDTYRQFNNYNAILDIVDVVTSVQQGDSGGTVQISNDGLTIVYTPAEDFVGTETFQYTADGTYIATVRVNVSESVRDDRQKVYPDVETSIDVLANDFFADEAPDAEITFVGESQIGATIRLGDDGIIYYTMPEEVEDLRAGDSFEYTVNDTETATVRINFQIITSRAFAKPDYVAVDRPIAQVVRVLDNDIFDRHYQGERRITGVSVPSKGGSVTISGDGSFLTYTPGAINETFTYTVDDRFTATVRSRSIYRLNSDRPVIDQNSDAITIDVLANDFQSSRIDERYGVYAGLGELTSVTTSEVGGSVEIVDGKIRYVPPVDFVGSDRFEYTVDDFLITTVTVHVIRRADDDVVRVDSDSQDNQLTVLINDLLGADYEGAGIITAVDGSAGVASIAEDGRSVFYTPEPGFVGEDQFVYTVDGRSKATATVVVQDQVVDALPQFESIEQLRDQLLELSIDRYYGQNRYYESDVAFDFARLTSDRTVDFSETNVQVAGVDEDDLVETDGNYIYSLRGSDLAIVSSLVGGQIELVSQTAIEGQAIGIYLSGDRLTVVSQPFEERNRYRDHRVTTSSIRLTSSSTKDGILLRPRAVDDTTIVTVFDISDRSNPSVVQQIRMDGDFISSRRIDDQVFLVLNSGNLFFEPINTTTEDGALVRETEEEFVARVQQNYAELLQDILPSYEAFSANTDFVRVGKLVVPEDIFWTGDDSASLTVVVSVNMAASEAGLASTVGVLTSKGGEIYANAESLYIFKPDRDPQDQQPATQILKFDWDGQTGSIDFAATGTVAGRVLNQFSADQQGDILRITTSISNRGTGTFSGENETAIFTLQDDNGVLEFVGSLQNVAPGENVKSVRYFGDRAFVTTFRVIDPLFAVDLSDPTDPRLMGHASIPGYSDYAQVISADRLLTVGRDRGTAFVSLFDISDFANPELIDLYQLPRLTTSEASLDHRAFGWFAPHDILALPTGQVFNERWDEDEDGYPEATRRVQNDALTILHVGVDDVSGQEGISLRGRIQHEGKVIRSVYIGQYIYSVGTDAVRAVEVGAEDTVVGEDAFTFVDGWQNKVNQWDVNNDGEVTSLDALLVINALARLDGSDLPTDRVMRQIEAVTKYVDTNGDGKLTALDALRVINRLSADDPESEHLSDSSLAIYSAPKLSAKADDDDRDSVTTIVVDSPAKI